MNHCHYCLAAHGAALRELSGDPIMSETIAQNWRAAGLDARRTAMLDFVTKLTERPDTILESDRQALRDAGFSNRAIFDIAQTAGFFAMSNRVASATDMRPNAAYHGMAR
nr:peroxidase-related enzyme [Jiella pelagia]